MDNETKVYILKLEKEIEELRIMNKALRDDVKRLMDEIRKERIYKSLQWAIPEENKTK